MNKFLNIIKDKNILVIIAIIIIVTGSCLFVGFAPNDELWNFANAFKMFNGYKIYEDLNVIITPLFFYIAQLFFYIFGPTMLSFRIYNIFINIILILLIYELLKTLKMKKNRASLYTFFVLYILTSLMIGGANYNIMALIPILINLIIIIKNKNNRYISGFLLFLTFLLKQNVFVCHAIGLIIYEFVTKKDTKKFLKSIIKTFLTCGVFILLFLLQLYLNNNLYDFINYCFLGIMEFGQKNIGYEMYGVIYIYISAIMMILIISIFRYSKLKEKVEKSVLENLKILLSFGVPLIIMSYPIINYYHTTLSVLILIISFVYLIDDILLKHFIEDNKKIKITCIIIIGVIVLYYIYTIIWVVVETNKPNYSFKDSPYYGTFSTEENLEDIKTMCNYIENQEKNNINVKIFSYKANLYMVPLNKNNEIFDLPFLGNLGTEGEQGLINKIKELKNTIILIETDFKDIFGQESQKAREYIINNYEKKGEIQEFSIYYIK